MPEGSTTPDLVELGHRVEFGASAEVAADSYETCRTSLDRWNRGEGDTVAFHADVEFLPRRTATEGLIE
jgi:hypothetical protein